MSETEQTDAFTELQEYNAKDCIATLALLPKLLEQLDPFSQRAYDRVRSLQAPALSMMLRGIFINEDAVGPAVEAKQKEMAHLKWMLDYVANQLTGQEELSPQSPKQIAKFFGERLGATPVKLQFKGKFRETWNREALEKVRDTWGNELLRPLLDAILEYRDLKGIVNVLTKTKRRGRMHSSFNIAGTNTFRWSSSKSAFWDGDNLQNITEELRHIFIADPGYKLLNVDLKSGDSYHVALDHFARTGDDRYLRACQDTSIDIHTAVTRLVFKDIAWTGDPVLDRQLAELPYYRHYDSRFLTKKLGHGTNYYGKAPTLARHSKLDVMVVEEFQRRYFEEFGLDLWHHSVIHELQTNKCLVNIYGDRRWFHGRLDSGETQRAAIAYLGQSATAHVINDAIVQIHERVPDAQLLGQVHDSVILQYPQSEEARCVPDVLRCFELPAKVSFPGVSPEDAEAYQELTGKAPPPAGDHTLTIPVDAAIGWNWGKFAPFDTKKGVPNPDGLKAWNGGEEDKRTRYYDPSVPLLDRRIR